MKEMILNKSKALLSALGRKVYHGVLNGQDHWVGAITLGVICLIVILAIV